LCLRESELPESALDIAKHATPEIRVAPRDKSAALGTATSWFEPKNPSQTWRASLYLLTLCAKGLFKEAEDYTLALMWEFGSDPLRAAFLAQI
jgi:hypothetical protein